MKQGKRLSDIFHIISSSIIILVFSTLFELLSGYLFLYVFLIGYLPGILIIVPPLIQIKGIIATRFATKFSTNLHLGTIKPQLRNNTKKFKADLISQILIILIIAGLFSLMMSIVSFIFNYQVMDIYLLMILAFSVILLAGMILTSISIIISVVSFKYGLDPDSFIAPVLGFLGDILGISIFYGILFLLQLLI